MSASIRHTALNSAKTLGRALTNQNVQMNRPSRQPGCLTSLQSLQSRRNIQTTQRFWTAQHEKNADGLIDRESLNPSRSEGTQTGTDDEVASHDASFDPNNTAPESEIAATEKESSERNKTSNPLDVSPGNKEVNKTRDPSKDPPESGVERPQSAKGWTRKSKQVNQDK